MYYAFIFLGDHVNWNYTVIDEIVFYMFVCTNTKALDSLVLALNEFILTKLPFRALTKDEQRFLDASEYGNGGNDCTLNVIHIDEDENYDFLTNTPLLEFYTEEFLMAALERSRRVLKNQSMRSRSVIARRAAMFLSRSDLI